MPGPGAKKIKSKSRHLKLRSIDDLAAAPGIEGGIPLPVSDWRSMRRWRRLMLALRRIYERRAKQGK